MPRSALIRWTSLAVVMRIAWEFSWSIAGTVKRFLRQKTLQIYEINRSGAGESWQTGTRSLENIADGSMCASEIKQTYVLETVYCIIELRLYLIFIRCFHGYRITTTMTGGYCKFHHRKKFDRFLGLLLCDEFTTCLRHTELSQKQTRSLLQDRN